MTLLISSFGGWSSGTLAAGSAGEELQITILWYSVFTFFCAFAQNFEQLFILRALHGFGFGGERAAGAVLMGEVIRDKYRGRGVGLVQTGWAVGWGASALVYTAVYGAPESLAWRVLFGIGLLPGLCVLHPAAYRRAGDLHTQRAARARSRLLAPVLGAFAACTWRRRSRCR